MAIRNKTKSYCFRYWYRNGTCCFSGIQKICSSGNVIGIDKEKQCIDFCINQINENKLGNKIKFIHFDLNDKIPLPDKYVDIIFSRSVLMHLQNKDKIIEELSRILKNNGKIVLFEALHYDKIFKIYKYRRANQK